MVTSLFLTQIRNHAFFNKTPLKKALMIISVVISATIIVALECYIYISLYDKANIFTGFNYPFVILIDAILFLLNVVFLVPAIEKTYFKNEQERLIFLSRPIKDTDVLVAKAMYIYLQSFAFTLLTIFPITLIYGLKYGAGFLFYLTLFFTPFVLAFVALMFSFLLAIPYHEITKFFKGRKIILLVIALIGGYLLAYAYSLLLNLFVSLVQNASLDNLFNTNNINIITNLSTYLWPIYNILQIATYHSFAMQTLLLLLVICGSFLVGLFPFMFYYSHTLKHTLPEKKRRRTFLANQLYITSVNKALIRKEFTLITSKNDDSVFSYSTLIALQPFLIYLVVSALNVIFHSGNLNYIRSLFPAIYSTIDASMIFLFLAVINGAVLSLNNERNTIKLIKTIPVKFDKQLLIKFMVPFTLSSISFLLTDIVLVSTLQISWVAFIFLLFNGTLMIALLNFMSLYSSLKKQKNGDLLTIIVDFVAPLGFVLVAALSTIFIKFPNSLASDAFFYGLILALEVLLLIPFVLMMRKKFSLLLLRYDGGEDYA